MIHITRHTSIDENRIDYQFSRSGGPGGQHVNKVSTRVTASFDVAASPNLSEKQKQIILRKLAGRCTKEGILLVSSQEHRSQHANRQNAHDRLINLLQNALRKPKKRQKTRPPRRAKEKRLKNKKHRGQIKQMRSKPIPEN